MKQPIDKELNVIIIIWGELEMGVVIPIIVIGFVSIAIAKCLDNMWRHEEAYNWQTLIVWGIGALIPVIVNGCIAFSILFTYDIVSDGSALFAVIFLLCWNLIQFFLFLLVYNFERIVEWMKRRDKKWWD